MQTLYLPECRINPIPAEKHSSEGFAPLPTLKEALQLLEG